MDETTLRQIVREECRAAVEEAIQAALIRALGGGPEPEREPATWSMSVPDVARMVAAATEPGSVREVLLHERRNPNGPRGGLIAACEVRLAELEQAVANMAMGA